MKNKAPRKGSKARAHATGAAEKNAKAYSFRGRKHRASDSQFKQKFSYKTGVGLAEFIRGLDPEAPVPTTKLVKEELAKLTRRAAVRMARRKDKAYPHYESLSVRKLGASATTAMNMYVRDFLTQIAFLGSEKVLRGLVMELARTIDPRDRPPTDSAKIRARLYQTVEQYLLRLPQSGALVKLYRRVLPKASAPMKNVTPRAGALKELACIDTKATGNSVLDQAWMSKAHERFFRETLEAKRMELEATRAMREWSRTVTMLSPSAYVVQRLHEACLARTEKAA